jgi:excisionase family DNA binding protein
VATNAGELLAEHLVAAIVRHVRQLARDGMPVPPGLLDLASIVANASHSRPEFDRSPSDVDSSHMPPIAITYEAAAAAHGVSVRTIRRRVHAGELPVIGTGRGRRVLVAGLTGEAQ